MRAAPMSVLVVFTSACHIVSGLDEFQADAGGAANAGGQVAQGGAGASANGGSANGGNANGGNAGTPSTGGSAPMSDYPLGALPTGSALIIDGNCDEAVWSTVAQFPFSGFKSSDNTNVDCRLLWSAGTAPTLYGCCEIADTSLEAVQTDVDVDEIYNDDAIEVIVAGDSDDNAEGALKILINGTTAQYDGVFSDPLTVSSSYNGGLTAARVVDDDFDGQADDQFWRVEWSVQLPFSITANQLGKCQIVIDDRDSGNRTVWQAYGEQGEINLASEWGTCAFVGN